MLSLSQIFVRPVVTEKSMATIENSRYVFLVHKHATKQMVKSAAKKVLGVDVVKVNILRKLSKSRRYGRTEGRTNEYKKAYITIKPGQKIELFES